MKKEDRERLKKLAKREWAKEVLLNRENNLSFTQIVRLFFLARPYCYKDPKYANVALAEALNDTVDFLLDIIEINQLEGVDDE